MAWTATPSVSRTEQFTFISTEASTLPPGGPRTIGGVAFEATVDRLVGSILAGLRYESGNRTASDRSSGSPRRF